MTATEPPAVAAAVRVEGVVQGVGFRPFVYTLATGLGLRGRVGNDADGVWVEIEGSPSSVRTFIERLARDAPSLARVDRVTTTPVSPSGAAGFAIAASTAGGPRRALIAADAATCADCLRELFDPGDRRFRYPFVNCTNCGPRFTIVTGVPYDRPLTTMVGFEMCARCAAEYSDPADRRYHAQPVCCPACGPRLSLSGAAGVSGVSGVSGASGAAGVSGVSGVSGAAGVPGDPLEAAAALLRDGRIVAVKGLGGYHLAAAADDEQAVAALRTRKHREDKPFALLAASLADARALCSVDDAAADLLTSRARPVVLLPRLDSAVVADAVAPGNSELGIMLPYTPLHHLLARSVGRPIVLTSGNVSDEPIAYVDGEARERLGGIADAFLTHDRAVHIRTDDSVARIARGRPALLRRSRGYVPEPLDVPGGFPRPLLACGAELKNTFCLAKEGHAFVSHHIGDLENAETLRSYASGIDHFRRLFDIEPVVVAYDLHPEYLSTKYALDLPGVDLVGVQHHHAHIASCLADNGWPGTPGERVIGVAFDGTGYGLDGTLWGGEFLVADYASFTREGHFAPVALPGGAAAIRQPWRMAASYLDAAGLDTDALPSGGLDVRDRRDPGQWSAILSMARRRINAPFTSSAGRLFDAVAALLGVRDIVNYEGQAAIELEQLAAASGAGVAGVAGAGVAGAGAAGAGADSGDAYRARIGSYRPPSREYRPEALPSEVPGDGVSGDRPSGVGVSGNGPSRAGVSGNGPSRAGVSGNGPSGVEVSGAGVSGAAGAAFAANGSDLVRAVFDDLTAGVPRPVIAARFHHGVARLVEDGCLRLRERYGLGTVALSGGVFQNVLLTSAVVSRLETRGFEVLTHSRVPCNDGGISLGQAVVAAARDRSARRNHS